jgi:uncharacterized peroxidase-related enzyme
MSRIQAIDPATAQGRVKDLLAGVQKALGVTPNLFRIVAHSPAALEGLVSLNGALSQGALSAKVREQIALAVAERNGCDYCLSAHSLVGKAVGLGDNDIAQARMARAADAKTDAALRFASGIVERRGQASDGDIAALRQAGFGDGEIIEIVTVTVLNILTNYLNHVLATDIDFPVVRAKASAAA